MTAINTDDWPGPFRLRPARVREISSYPLKSVILQYKLANNAHRRANDASKRANNANRLTPAKQEINVNTIDK